MNINKIHINRFSFMPYYTFLSYSGAPPTEVGGFLRGRVKFRGIEISLDYKTKYLENQN